MLEAPRRDVVDAGHESVDALNPGGLARRRAAVDLDELDVLGHEVANGA